MGPVKQNPIQRTVRTAHLSVIMTLHNFSTQYNTEQFWQSSLLPPGKHHVQRSDSYCTTSTNVEGSAGFNTIILYV